MSDKELNELFSNAVDSGVLSPSTSSMLTGNLGSIVVAGAAGVAIETIAASEVTLFTLLVDASSSIADGGLEQAVRDGQNELLAALRGSKTKDSILVASWIFSDQQRVVHAYVPVDDATGLDASNYRGQGSTRLYDTWCDALLSNVAYAERLRDGGTPVRSVVVVITDGCDVGSSRSARHCASLSKDLLASEQFVLAFVGVGSERTFRKIAADMGIPPGSVEVAKDATPKTLRRIFQMVSQSAIRASQSRIAAGIQTGFFRP